MTSEQAGRWTDVLIARRIGAAFQANSVESSFHYGFVRHRNIAGRKKEGG